LNTFTILFSYYIVGTRGNANTNKSGGMNSVPEYEARVALMLMLHQRKEDKLNVEREKQMLKTMEECTFTPAIQKSTRTFKIQKLKKLKKLKCSKIVH
jgi:hypothetical protein